VARLATRVTREFARCSCWPECRALYEDLATAKHCWLLSDARHHCRESSWATEVTIYSLLMAQLETQRYQTDRSEDLFSIRLSAIRIRMEEVDATVA
jgi:hypothetical protein